MKTALRCSIDTQVKGKYKVATYTSTVTFLHFLNSSKLGVRIYSKQIYGEKNLKMANSYGENPSGQKHPFTF